MLLESQGFIQNFMLTCVIWKWKQQQNQKFNIKISPHELQLSFSKQISKSKLAKLLLFSSMNSFIFKSVSGIFKTVSYRFHFFVS